MGWLEIFKDENELLTELENGSYFHRSVLVVDDEVNITDTMGRFLQEEGYRVFLATNGMEALETFRIKQPRIVVTDLMMPGMSGIDLIREIRAMDKETEIIVLTGHGDMDKAITALRHQVSDFLIKPIDLLVLRHAIEKARTHLRLKDDVREYTAELERLYAEVRGNKEHVESIFNHAPIAVITYDAQGRILSWNRRAEEITGYTREEAETKNLLDIFVFNGSLFSDEDLANEAMTNKKTVGQILNRKQQMRYIEREGTVLRDKGNNRVKIIESFTDVTERIHNDRLLEKRYLQVQIINEIGKKIAASTDINELLAFITQRLVKTFFESATVAIFLKNEAGMPCLKAAAGLSVDTFLQSYPPEKEAPESTALQHILKHNQRLVESPVNTIPPLTPGYPSFFGFPISTQSKIYGVLYIENNEAMYFDDGDLFLLEAIAEYIAISMDRLALIEKITRQNELLEKQASDLKEALGQVEAQKGIIEEKNKQLEKDLKKAGDLQKSLLPERLPDSSGLHCEASFTPSHQLGGDFYDVFEINENMTGFLIADATGHGVSSAMLSAMFKMTLGKYARTETDPGRVFKALNHDFCNVVQTGDFFTAFYGVVDHARHKLIYSNAAHPLPLLYDYQSKTIETLDSEGFLLGVMDEGITYETRERDLTGPIRLFVYTDGLQEAINSDGEQFGDARIEKAMRRYARYKAGTFLHKIVEDLKNYTGNASGTFDDDLTLLVLDINK
ncbi:MAG: response regulator [Calditrichaeota bacterium]|nr:MAG: response regulator [Calditrichota bacterium]